MEKSQVRSLIKEKIDNISQEKLKAEDEAVVLQVLDNPIWQQAKSIFCYVSWGREIKTYPLLKASLEQGKNLSVPLIVGKGIMEARHINSLDSLHPDIYGIPAPSKSSPIVKSADIDLIIVPGVAFDTETLLRLGRGGGYYDRYLADCKAFRLAVARDCQLVEKGVIPQEKYDQRMDMLITSNKIYSKLI